MITRYIKSLSSSKPSTFSFKFSIYWKHDKMINIVSIDDCNLFDFTISIFKYWMKYIRAVQKMKWSMSISNATKYYIYLIVLVLLIYVVNQTPLWLDSTKQYVRIRKLCYTNDYFSILPPLFWFVMTFYQTLVKEVLV